MTCCAKHRFVCVSTETRHLDRLGQLGEFEQDSNTDTEQESNTGSRKYAFCVFVWARAPFVLEANQGEGAGEPG